MIARIAGCVAILALIGAAPGASGRVVHYQPREETIPPILSDEASQIVVANCMSCHSLDYLTTQPRGKGTKFWRDEVTKMIAVYKAPVEPADADAIVAALDRKFGGGG
ncbi:MAG: cytochrome C [Proteobacteria bacterium]|nr:cytochrome C [Pseudomonadota bacterium]